MLLIDGVKYQEWVPEGPRAEDEFEQEVKEHTLEIFGEQSIYLDRKQKLKSLSGIGSIPDGYVIGFGDAAQWHIVEVELSSHPLHDHIVSQVSRFISGISNQNIQRGIVNAIDEEIARNDFVRLKLRKAIEPAEIYRFLTDLISKPPILTIIIEKDTEELREALNTLRYPQIKVVEFQTFAREEIGLAVHAHLFEPMYKPIREPPLVQSLPPIKSPLPYIEIPVRSLSNIKWHYFEFSKEYRSFFPGFKVPFTLETLETDVGEIQTAVVGAKRGTPDGDSNAGYYIQRNLGKWVKRHGEMKVGDKLRITAIEPMKKYRLEIVK